MLFLLLLLWGDGQNSPDDFEALDPKVWEYGVDPEKGIYDAMVLKSSFTIDVNQISRELTLRIFSEEGRSAAEVKMIGQTYKNLRGRVTTREGLVSYFGEDDLIEALLFKIRRKKSKARMMLPPGITNDCVVELKWEQEAYSGFIKGAEDELYAVPGPYYVLEKSYLVTNAVLNPVLAFVTRLISFNKGDDPVSFEESSTDKGKLFVFRNVPVRKSYPYGNIQYDPIMPYFTLRALPLWAKGIANTDEFWKTTVKEWIVEDLKASKKSKAYRNFLDEIKQTLPTDQQDALYALAEQFRSYFFDLDMPDPSKKAEIEKLKDKDEPEQRIKQALATRFASSDTFFKLFYQTARDCGLPIVVIYPHAFALGPFYPGERRLDLFLWNHPLIGLPVGENLALIMPQRRDIALGLLPSYVSGGIGLLVDPNKDFSYNFIKLPQAQPEENAWVESDQLTLDAEHKLSLTSRSQFSGSFEQTYRLTYFSLSKDELEEKLRVFNPPSSNWEITSPKLIDLHDLNKPLGMERSASTSLEDFGSGLLVLDPFPLQPQPLDDPSNWPTNRIQPIQFGMPFTIRARAVLDVPQQVILQGNNDWEQANPMGKVSFSAHQEGQRIVVRREVVLAQQFAPADHEPLVKEFLGWVSAAYEQRLALATGVQP